MLLRLDQAGEVVLHGVLVGEQLFVSAALEYWSVDQRHHYVLLMYDLFLVITLLQQFHNLIILMWTGSGSI